MLEFPLNDTFRSGSHQYHVIARGGHRSILHAAGLVPRDTLQQVRGRPGAYVAHPSILFDLSVGGGIDQSRDITNQQQNQSINHANATIDQNRLILYQSMNQHLIENSEVNIAIIDSVGVKKKKLYFSKMEAEGYRRGRSLEKHGSRPI